VNDRRANPLLGVYLDRRADLERYFRVRLRSAEAAQDLVQDIYLKITQSPAEAVENPTAYLYRLGSNLMLDQIKRQRRQERRADAWGQIHRSVVGGDATTEDPAADDVVMSREELRLVVDAIRELPPQVQKAFRLHKLEGLSHAETAAAMGVSRSSVEKYLMTCLRHILGRVRR